MILEPERGKEAIYTQPRGGLGRMGGAAMGDWLQTGAGVGG